MKDYDAIVTELNECDTVEKIYDKAIEMVSTYDHGKADKHIAEIKRKRVIMEKGIGWSTKQKRTWFMNAIMTMIWNVSANGNGLGVYNPGRRK